MKVLVTGAAGFIGHALCRRLLTDSYEVVGLDNINDYYDVGLKYDRLADIGVSQEEAKNWNDLVTSSEYDKFHFVRMDVQNRVLLPKLFKTHKFDIVIHLAAQAGVRYSIENPEAYIDSNVVGFLNILECCRHNQIKHLIYASSSSVYGENSKVPFQESDIVDAPVSLYAATKKSNELMAHTYSHLFQLPTSGLRFFTVYGPWGRPDMAPMLFANAIKKGKPIKVFNNGDMQRDFTYIDDVIKGIIITLKNPPAPKITSNAIFNSGIKVNDLLLVNKEIVGEQHSNQVDDYRSSPYYQLFNIGNGSPVHLLEFIQVMEDKLGVAAKMNMMEMQPGDVSRTWANTSQLDSLGYQATTSIKEGIETFVKWFEKHN